MEILTSEKKRKYYSVSQLRLFAQCPTAYYHRYVLGLEERPAYNLVAGSSGHAALEQDNLSLIQGSGGISAGQALDIAVTEFKTRAEQLVEAERDVDKFVKDLKKPLGRYIGNRPVQDVPVAAEKRYEVEVAGRPFVAIVDVEYEGLIADYKFVGRRKSARDVDLDPQLYIYQSITGKDPYFIQLLKGKDDIEVACPKVSRANAVFLDRWIKNTIRALESCLSAEIWPQCSTGSWWCGPDCASWFQCSKEVV